MYVDICAPVHALAIPVISVTSIAPILNDVFSMLMVNSPCARIRTHTRSHTHILKRLVALGRNAAVSLDYFIDVHAHTTALNGFMYCNGDGVERGRDFPGSHRRFVRVKNDFHLSFDDNLPTFENHSIREKVGTGRQQKLDGATTDGGADDCMGEDESRSENEINGNNIHNHISTSSNAYSSGATRESATTLIRLANDEEDFPRLLDAHSKHFSFHKVSIHMHLHMYIL